jgi:methyl-accepting chemotaxis protein
MNAVVVAFLIIAAIGLFLQGAGMLGMLIAAAALRKQVLQATQETKQKADKAVQTALEVLADARDPVKTVSANVAEISKLVRDRTIQIDQTIEDITNRTRSQVARADEVVSSVLDKVENTANVVERNIISPVVEISAIFKGVQVGLERLFRGRASSVREATQDEEMFI